MKRTSNGTPVWIAGTGPAVVLVHGVLMDHRMWDAQLRALSDSYRVLCFDMLGHGQAPNPDGSRSLGDFVAQVHEVMTQYCPGERAVLAGFSMGALVAQAYAIEHWPDLRGLILLNAVYERSAPEREAVGRRLKLMEDGGVESVVEPAMQRWFSAVEKRERSAEIANIIAWMRDGPFAPKLKAYRVFATSDPLTAGKLHAVRCPALIMTGAGDVGSPPHMAEKMAAELPAAQLHILDAQQHMMPVLDADRVCATMRNFLDGLPA